jgi:hypothetical protein
MNQALAIREGDVFRFQWSEAEYAKVRPGGDLNWCFDGQLVMRNGKLWDTYWGFDGFSCDSKWFTKADAEARGTLTFVCNLNDVEIVRDRSRLRYFDDADCFNLCYQHGCYKQYAVRKGAQRSQTKMLSEVEEKVRNVRGEIESAVRSGMSDLERLAEYRAKVTAGDLDVHVWW